MGERDKPITKLVWWEKVLIVVSAIVLSLLFFTDTLFRVNGQTKDESAKIAIGVFGQALRAYKRDCGNYPSNTAGLKALSDNNEDCKQFLEPYIKPKQLIDPWGRPYDYMSDGTTITITSFGRDGKPGGDWWDADIVVRITDDSIEIVSDN